MPHIKRLRNMYRRSGPGMGLALAISIAFMGMVLVLGDVRWLRLAALAWAAAAFLAAWSWWAAGD